tara:strand:- start:1135 stop:2439 length:1305 start_codon:yes stop_codon:yes gene_type:complete
MATSVAVVGGGIAGLSFAISLALRSPASRYSVTIYEKYKDEIACKGRYAHSLSIRKDLGGIDALQDLELLQTVEAKTTPSRGFYIASSSASAGLKMAVNSAWFNSSEEFQRLRVNGHDLWCKLLQRARDLGISIQFDNMIENVHPSGSEDNDSDKHIIVGKQVENGQKFEASADIVIVSDGAQSVCRERLTRESTNSLGYTIVGAVMKVDDGSEFPQSIRHQLGLIVGHGHSLTIAEESEGTVLLRLVFPAEREYSLETDNELMRQKVAAAIPQFPSFRKLLIRLTEEDVWKEAFLVNCRDRYPVEWKGSPSIFFLGDSSHVVSPYAGGGADMALADGNALGKLIGEMIIEDKEVSMEEVQKQFQEETMAKWRAIVSVFQYCHSTSWLSTLVRGTMFTLLPFTFSPDYRVWRIVFTISLTVGSAFTFAKRRNLI